MIQKLPCGIELKLVDSEYDVYLDMALEMLDAILLCQEENRNCIMIVPVGPTNQYPILAELVNRLKVNLHHVHFFNMDEYMLTPTKTIASDHFMSFHKRMEEVFYSRVNPELTVPKIHRHFPQPGKEAEFDTLLEQLGGVELCLGGLGINGHLAFNEPPEPGVKISVEAFASLSTRVLSISRETRTINAYSYQRGDILGMPEYCITVGMKQILASRNVYIALNRDWQHGIAKHALHGPITAQVPASLLQRHPRVRFCAPLHIGEGLW